MPGIDANFIGGSITLMLDMIVWIIVAQAILSWFIRDYSHPVMRILGTITDPILKPVSKLLARMGLGGTMFDFSPLAVILIISFIQQLI